MNSTYACIMAGGSGERFWPLSRAALPKHLVPLLSSQTLLEETVRRVEKAIPREHIFVLTNEAQIGACRSAVPHLPAEQFIAEPAKRDTAPACALGTALARRRDPNAVVAFLPADAWIKDTATFAEQFRAAAAFAAAQPNIVTFGIRPTRPAIGFGYLEVGEALPQTTLSAAFFRVKKFKEKPDAATAQGYLESKNFLWNAGIFLWRVETFLKEAHRLQPELARFIEEFPEGKFASYLKEKFPLLPKISVDYAIMEQAGQVALVEARFDWDDVGTWTALPKHLASDANGNTLRGNVHAYNSRNNIALAHSRFIALCGVEDLIVVETADSILVCHRDQAEKIKELQGTMPEHLK